MDPEQFEFLDEIEKTQIHNCFFFHFDMYAFQQVNKSINRSFWQITFPRNPKTKKLK